MPARWKTERHAAGVLTRDYFLREYVQRRRGLAELATETGIPRHILSRVAREAGIEIRSASPCFPIDEKWLREQYLIHKRSTNALATELGIEQATLVGALHRHNISVRSAGTRSFPEMIATYEHLPPGVRAAVEGTLHGWQRLHRFQVTMAFPTICLAANYLGINKSGLQTQLQRLERDLGQTLFVRSAGRRPQQPTPYGRALLDDLSDRTVRAELAAALDHDPHPDPGVASPAQIAAAVHSFTAPRPARTPQPLPGIPVARIRMNAATRALLRQMMIRPTREFYGYELAQSTGLSTATVGPRLRQLEHLGWITSRTADAYTPVTHAPHRRRVYFRFTRLPSRHIPTRSTCTPQLTVPNPPSLKANGRTCATSGTISSSHHGQVRTQPRQIVGGTPERYRPHADCPWKSLWRAIFRGHIAEPNVLPGTLADKRS
ncbi:LysR family transcriptional regulator [Nocardia sp. NPDC059246]|uniref:LysR family transcriptional regulator n=1 Tax=unclassified Nocardia TaxID=2637762 RepID=UPI0036A7EC94